MAWYNASWLNRVKVTIQVTEVNATLTNFPVYVDLSDLPAEFHSNVNQTDARDIRITQSDGTTELAREVVVYDSGTNTGELHFNANSVSSSVDTDFYIYYDNSAATEPAVSDTYGRNNTWSNSYVIVVHGNAFTDSTGNRTVTNHSATANQAGKVGKAIDFTAGDDIDYGAAALGVTDNISIEAWTYIHTDGNSSIAVKHGGGSPGYGFLWGRERVVVNDSAKWIFSIDGSEWTDKRTGADVWPLNTWMHSAVDYNGTTSNIYLDGVEEVSGDFPLTKSGNIYPALANAVTGNIGDTSTGLDGLVDELRLSNTTRSAAYYAATYSNQNTPTTFYVVSAIETFSVRTIEFSGQVDTNAERTITFHGMVNVNAERTIEFSGAYGWRAVEKPTTTWTAVEKPIGVT